MNHVLLPAALPGAILAQVREGTWQAAIMPANQNREICVAFNQGVFYNLESGRHLNLGAIALQGNVVKLGRGEGSRGCVGDRQRVKAAGELSGVTIGWRAPGDKVQS